MKISEIQPPRRVTKQPQLNFKGAFEQKLHDQYAKLISSEQSKNETPSLQWKDFQTAMNSKYNPANISEEDAERLFQEMYENGFLKNDEYCAIYQKVGLNAQVILFNVINFDLEFHGDLLSYIRNQIADTMQRLHCINTGYFDVSDDGKEMVGDFKENLQTRAKHLENVYNLLAQITGTCPYTPKNNFETSTPTLNDDYDVTKLVDNPLLAPIALKNRLYTFTEDWFLQIWNRVFAKEDNSSI